MVTIEQGVAALAIVQTTAGGIVCGRCRGSKSECGYASSHESSDHAVAELVNSLRGDGWTFEWKGTALRSTILARCGKCQKED